MLPTVHISCRRPRAREQPRSAGFGSHVSLPLRVATRTLSGWMRRAARRPRSERPRQRAAGSSFASSPTSVSFGRFRVSTVSGMPSPVCSSASPHRPPTRASRAGQVLTHEPALADRLDRANVPMFHRMFHRMLHRMLHRMFHRMFHHMFHRMFHHMFHRVSHRMFQEGPAKFKPAPHTRYMRCRHQRGSQPQSHMRHSRADGHAPHAPAYSCPRGPSACHRTDTHPCIILASSMHHPCTIHATPMQHPYIHATSMQHPCPTTGSVSLSRTA